MDTIFIENLVVSVRIGAGDEERAVPQRIRIDLEFGTDFGPMLRSMDLADGVDYADVRKAMICVAETGEFRFLEELAVRLAERLLGYANVETATVAVAKMDRWRKAIPGVRVTRNRGGPRI
ncbi:MAG TPA: dihydroneopterin aldolase [Candidatus Paceibacterota bacterium]|nr:dihydroneopterin aldolase [Candidatus Paceibacterota bacterium]